VSGFTWHRRELPPWERSRGHTAEHGLDLGEGGWVVCRHCYMHRERFTGWQVAYAPCGLKGPRPSIVVLLFATRTLGAAKALTDLWAATVPRGEDG